MVLQQQLNAYIPIHQHEAERHLTGNDMGLETLMSVLNDIPSPIRPYLLILTK